MKKKINGLLGFVMVLTATGALLPVKAGAQDLTMITGEEGVHVMPLPDRAATNVEFDALQALGTPALVYHGGPVMTTATTFAIFWAPSTLQNGHSTSLPASYQNIQTDFLRAYPGHGIANNNTQYYMTTGSSTTQVHTYVRNVGGFGGSYVDTAAYPASA